MPDKDKANARTKKKRNPNLKPKAWVGFDFKID